MRSSRDEQSTEEADWHSTYRDRRKRGLLTVGADVYSEWQGFPEVFIGCIHSSTDQVSRGSSAMFPMWLHLVVAAAIAGMCFIVGQLAPGFGVAFMTLASTIWVAVSVSRERRWRQDG